MVLIVPVLVGMGSWALADSGGTGKHLEAIRQRMEQGQAQYVGKNYDVAASIFEEGYRLYPYSAFLFNAGVCYQKLGNYERAIDRFREYLRVDPSAPDASKVNERIAALELQRAADAGTDAGDAGAEDAGEAADGGVSAGPPPTIGADDANAMKSLVVIETEPVGAPLRVYQRVGAAAGAFRIGATNEGWIEVASTRAPSNLTLAVGRYHIVVEKFSDFNLSHTDIDVLAGHVHQFKANLSQGEFMAFLRVAANVEGAYLYVDDREKKRPPWGVTPHGELIAAGKHEVLVEAPGFEPMLTTVDVKHGEQREMEVRMARVGYGIVRIASNAPEIQVALDGEPKGVWMFGDRPLEFQAQSGQHKIEITGRDRKDFEGLIEVPRGQVLPIHATMIQSPGRGAAWAEGLLGVALIGGGVVCGTLSNSIYEDLEADRKAGTLEENDSRATTGKWLAVGSNVGFLGGAVLIGLSTYNFIDDPLPESSTQYDEPVEFDDPKKARPTALVVPLRPRPTRQARKDSGFELHPSVAPQGLGLGLNGRF
jgi:tetratricopeptide (TPR) repeat protein